jgi:MFS family permease
VTGVRSIAWHRVPLYLGGFLGPLGTLVMIPMIPELRDDFGASTGAIGWGITAYLLAMASFLLVAGTIGERVGRRRTLRTTYLVYGAASLGCVFAPNLEWFIGFRVLQGVANAFITPLLLAALAEVTEPARFGRASGVYGSFQALGGAGAPLIGGLSADLGWRWGFATVALLAFGLASGLPAGGSAVASAGRDMKALVARDPLFLSAAVLFGAAGPLGTAVLVGVASRDELGLSGTAAGVVLLVGSSVPIVVTPFWGRIVDRVGSRRSATLGLIATSVVTSALVFGTSPVRLGLLWALGSVGVGVTIVSIQSLAATLSSTNRGGVISFTLAFRFTGLALAPVIWLPVFDRSPTAAFVGAALLGIPAVVLMARVKRGAIAA